MIRVSSGSGMGGMAFADSSGPVPPGPPIGGVDKAASAHALQQKMHRQRQLALERQRSTARKQLGAGVIASANPLMQASQLKGPQWDRVLPDGLSLPSPTAGGMGKSTKLTGSTASAEQNTAPSSPTDDDAMKVDQHEKGGKGAGSKQTLDDALDGLAEELLLDDRLPVQPSRSPMASPMAPGGPGAATPNRNSGMGPDVRGQPASQSAMAGGGNAWGGAEPLQKGGGPPPRNRADMVEEVGHDVMETPAYFNGPKDAPGRRRPPRQQTQIVGEDDDIQAYGDQVGPVNAQREAPEPVRGGGKMWDLNVEPAQPDRRSRVAAKEQKSGRGSTWWPFNGGPGQQQQQPAQIQEEVTAISAFNFDD
eukprot:gb/GFBE01076812.1/.p1 GENE.gb/GFBE01076812.1/~~gb/GFBE01076812.1/.p1  ORF type:complete len:364 (+),score=63.03 gb/GFBE01076812.1/:1-1092(+)